MHIRRPFLFAALVSLILAIPVRAQIDDSTKQLARSIFKQLIEINTTDSVGSTTVAAQAMAKRLLDAGFPKSDVQVLGPNPRKGNLVARIHGTGARKPILLICHTDVVEARREDWSMDPFKFIEKDGYFYGRGTEDVKDGDAILVTDFIRMKREGYKPDRDIILALTADEEGGTSNGVDWLLKNHRDLIDAEYILNPDGGDFEMDNGKHLLVGIEASEKLYADFQLEVHNKGGHSSLPVPENAIYQLADGLTRLQRYTFPFELNEVTRTYFEKEADIVGGQEGSDMKAILRSPPDEPAIERLSKTPFYNSRMRTTCVATRLAAGHANNALPGFARAVVNCRIFPGHTPEEIQQQLVKILAEPEINVTELNSSGLGPRANPPSPLRPDVMQGLEKVVNEMWPGTPVIPVMDAGATDGAISRAAGIPTYGVPGVFIDLNDDRSHGRDERLPAASFYEGVDFYYRFIKTLTSPQ
ncbi:MAG TPA: M20/M25/M40 family metallo-hydrolase [Candidatus Limnocylindrales bacterium]|nr:M20/M25/M40 family metallo-hydrolase [Candidatus Limnocylindrales bacterium]